MHFGLCRFKIHRKFGNCGGEPKSETNYDGENFSYVLFVVIIKSFCASVSPLQVIKIPTKLYVSQKLISYIHV